MKKFVVIIIIFTFMNIFCLSAHAEGITADSFDFSEIYEKIDAQTDELLGEIGINDSDFNDILELSPRKVIDLIIELIKGKWKIPFKTVGMVSCICVISSFVNTLNVSGIKNESLFSFFEASIVMLSVILPLSDVLSVAVSAMRLLSDFMLTYIPIFTGVISASGMSLSAFSYNAVMLSFSQICSRVSADLIIPSVFLFTLVSVFSASSPNVRVDDIISVVKKTVTVTLSLIASVFTGVLAIRSNIALAADSVAVKGIKLLSGSVIPIVGGAVGDAFSSVLGSFSLIKNTVGAFGVIVILLTVLPSVMSLLLWYLSLSLCSVICNFTGSNTTAAILKNISSCVSLVNAILIFFATVFVISTGIMLNLRN